MVSRVAVIALVAIVACPILLGYALNLSETTETAYRASDDSVIVTPLLTNDVYYSNVSMDLNNLNSSAYFAKKNINGIESQIIPIYNKTSSVSSSYPLTESIYTNQSWNGAPQTIGSKYFYEQWDYDMSQSQHSIDVYIWSGGAEVMAGTITNIHSFYYDDDLHQYTYSRYVASYVLGYGSGSGDVTKIVLWSANGTCNVYVAQYGSGNKYADIAAGFYYKGANNFNSLIRNALPDNTKSILLTINLNSITDSNYSMKITFNNEYWGYTLNKTTTGGVVSWTLTPQSGSGNTTPIELYYDPSRIDNTYQLSFAIEKTSYDNPSFVKYLYHTDFRYVGSWPTAIGEANAYQHYKYDGYAVLPAAMGKDLTDISYSDFSSYVYRTPTIRYDNAIVSGYETPVIFDNTYSPSSFRNDPVTTITNVSMYGDSITFGGSTYTVTDGSITVSGKKVPVDGLTLKSIPNENNSGYINMIGNTEVSETIDPSQIGFNGYWSAVVSTASSETYTYTHTEWTPGQFGWDGVDQNFLMVGLLTSLGVFIALGIYIRRTKANLWPLLIVCGGAAFIFFCML